MRFRGAIALPYPSIFFRQYDRGRCVTNIAR
jgi:hypothetical protein